MKAKEVMRLLQITRPTLHRYVENGVIGVTKLHSDFFSLLAEVGNKKLDAEEVFEEIVSLLHCYSMKLYSRRRNKTLEVKYNNGST